MIEFIQKAQELMRNDPQFLFRNIVGMLNLPVLVAGGIAMLFGKFWIAVSLMVTAIVLAEYWGQGMMQWFWSVYLGVTASIFFALLLSRLFKPKTRLSSTLSKIGQIFLLSPAIYNGFMLSECSYDTIKYYGAGF